MNALRIWSVVSVCVALGACAMGRPADPPLREDVRTGMFVFADWDGPSFPIHYAAPAETNADTRIVFVFHDARRDGREARDHWLAVARTQNVAVLAPEFSHAQFPRTYGYQLGGITTPSGAPRPQAQWTFSAIEPLFDFAKEAMGSTHDRYVLFGHSAGAQFVHRYVLHAPTARFELAVAANAGWYTLPDFALAWPYGLDGSQVSGDALAAIFAAPLVVMLGEADTDPSAPLLRDTPGAMAQGPHRYARGVTMMEAGRRAAFALDTPFAWRLVSAPDTGHNGAAMVEPAWRLAREAMGLDNTDAADTDETPKAPAVQIQLGQRYIRIVG